MKIIVKQNDLIHFVERVCEAQYDYIHGREGYKNEKYDEYFSLLENHREAIKFGDIKNCIFGKPSILLYNFHILHGVYTAGDEKYATIEKPWINLPTSMEYEIYDLEWEDVDSVYWRSLSGSSCVIFKRIDKWTFEVLPQWLSLQGAGMILHLVGMNENYIHGEDIPRQDVARVILEKVSGYLCTSQE